MLRGRGLVQRLMQRLDTIALGLYFMIIARPDL